jgi:hypothetical protein
MQIQTHTHTHHGTVLYYKERLRTILRTSPVVPLAQSQWQLQYLLLRKRSALSGEMVRLANNEVFSKNTKVDSLQSVHQSQLVVTSISIFKQS